MTRLGPLVARACLALAFLAPRGAMHAQDAPPLNRFAGERVVVLPLQQTSFSTPWVTDAGAAVPGIPALDSLLTEALESRGIAQWIFPAALARSARRNPTYLTDPYRIRAAGAVRRALTAKDAMILEPLASQLRSLIAVSDARYVLVPLNWAVQADSASGGTSSLELALVDARASQVRWSGTVRTDRHASYSTDVLRAAAAKAADLFVPPTD